MRSTPGLLVLGFLASVAPAQGDGFRSIFDGETLDGWQGDKRFWRVADGAITGQTTAEVPARRNQFLVWRRGELDDFELKLKYRIDNGNSGIQYRSRALENGGVKGYQADIEHGNNASGSLYDEHGRALLAARGQKTVVGDGRGGKQVGNVGDKTALQARIKKNDWNEYHITARGRRFVHRINGHVMCEVLDEGEMDFDRKGILALQIHGGAVLTVQFKDIRLKRLSLEKEKKIVFVGGRPSHGYGSHEGNAGSLFLARMLTEHVPGIVTAVYTKTWPADPTAFDNADAVVLYMNGGGGHPMLRHLGQLREAMDRGCGLACLHYAVEVPKNIAPRSLLPWIGGHFETHWSVNPTWTAEVKALPTHPVTRGVQPFTVHDEWYYHMRFQEGMRGVTPIVTAIPPNKTRERNDGPHSNNPTVRARRGEPEHVAWAFQRPGGGRGFGFTGGHFHWSWGHDQVRKLMLNALVWVAGDEVPEGGLASPTPSVDDLLANLDGKPNKRFNRDSLAEKLARWNADR